MPTPKTNQHIEIVELFEKHQLSEELIASELGVEEGVVISTLMQFSGIYKKLHENLARKENKTDEEYQELIERYRELAFFAEDENTKARCLEFLVNENRGRNDLGLKKLAQDKELAGVGGNKVPNVMIFNLLLEKGREQGKRISVNLPKIINLENSIETPEQKELAEVC